MPTPHLPSMRYEHRQRSPFSLAGMDFWQIVCYLRFQFKVGKLLPVLTCFKVPH
uniref:Uncharacterized protein n=1 Tax=Picea sitchensis TaxID=3332 RepID=A0A6B9XWD0_PICSI|nr:hypothetical protein Q903MT_gene5646 [Picea sitchensis]